MEIKDILAYVRRTNPEMTEERLIEELKQCHYSSVGLIFAAKNYEKMRNST